MQLTPTELSWLDKNEGLVNNWDEGLNKVFGHSVSLNGATIRLITLIHYMAGDNFLISLNHSMTGLTETTFEFNLLKGPRRFYITHFNLRGKPGTKIRNGKLLITKAGFEQFLLEHLTTPGIWELPEDIVGEIIRRLTYHNSVKDYLI